MLTKQSDKLQFVVCCETRFHRRIDKLKFIGHLLVILGLSSGFAQAQVTPDPHILESGKSIESKVAGGESHTYQISLAAGQTALVAAAHSLSETLLAPAAAELGNKRLVIVADGALQYVPFAMLPEPGSLDLGLRSSSKPVAQAITAKPQGPRPNPRPAPHRQSRSREPTVGICIDDSTDGTRRPTARSKDAGCDRRSRL